jgi:hypothetical protein
LPKKGARWIQTDATARKPPVTKNRQQL